MSRPEQSERARERRAFVRPGRRPPSSSVLTHTLRAKKPPLSQVLALRLGLGKKHPRMAPPEALAEIMQVPPGCLTPFAHCRPETKNVVLLLDEKLKAEKKVLFHPLRNDQSVGITVQGLETYLR